MGKYGETALMSVNSLHNGELLTPTEAWRNASIHFFGEGTSSQKKTCPKEAFIGLCEAGLVKGIGRTDRSRNKIGQQLNRQYAIKAVGLLKGNPLLAGNMNGLWYEVLDGERKTHNAQMEVVLALWQAGLLVTV